MIFLLSTACHPGLCWHDGPREYTMLERDYGTDPILEDLYFMFLASTMYWCQTQMPSSQPDAKAAKIRDTDLLGFRNIALYKEDI